MNWNGFFKFMSGFFAATSIVSFYLGVTHYTSTFLGYDVSSSLVMTKAIVHFVLFIIFFYFGFIKKQSNKN